ncbi:MAG TPA: NlpC/P60 family protein [Candidatus Kryptonia bacterium]
MNKAYKFLISICAISSLTIIGCSGSSPRFSSGNNGTVSSKPRFSYDETPDELKAEKVEVKTEDDHPVSLDKAKSEINKIAGRPGSASNLQSLFMEVILSYMGTPYHIGGTDHSGMDCSGFSMVVFDSVFKKQLPHSARQQSTFGESVSRDDLGIGDLIFFKTTGPVISHVGIYLGDDLFAHASVEQGVTISSLESTYYKRRYAGAKKIIGMSNGL